MNGTTLLLRQVHPSFVQDGFASSQAFRPTPKDHGLLSVYDGDLMEAQASWIHYTTVLKCASAGTAAVTMDECTSEGLTVRSDPDPFPEHAVVGFIDLPETHWRGKSKSLQRKAQARGWQFSAPQSE